MHWRFTRVSQSSSTSRTAAGWARRPTCALLTCAPQTSQAYARGPDNGKIFFVDLWYAKSGALFTKLGATAVPFAFRWSSTIAPRSSGKIVIPEEDRLGKGIQTYPWPAESVVSFFAGRTGLAAGEVDRPSFLKSPGELQSSQLATGMPHTAHESWASLSASSGPRVVQAIKAACANTCEVMLGEASHIGFVLTCWFANCCPAQPSLLWPC